MVNQRELRAENRTISASFQHKPGIYKQQGVVLIVALVFLVALTGVAAALMQNTTSDMKMTGASNEKVIATQAAISAVDEIIDNQMNIRETNLFTKGLKSMDTIASAELLPATTKTQATAKAKVQNNPEFNELHCPRSRVSNSVGIMECNFIELEVTRVYGRKDTSAIVINSGIAQQLLTNN